MRRLLLAPLILAAVLAPRPALAQIGAPIGSPIRFEPKPGTTLTIEGRGPFHGVVEIRREGGGVTIVNELDLDSYVKGVREVPGLWPVEALRAQAVAARTYVLWEMQKGYWERFGFDVCGTTSCQVYQGATAELGERGRRWAKAVEDTAGEVLLHEGVPALTRYHSSSGGRTLPNEVVYPSDGPRPYLQAVDDGADRVSPLHRWQQRFKREHLQEILRVAIQLQGEITDVTADEDARKVLIKTRGGELDMTSVRFRHTISEFAPRVYPQIYPGTRTDGEVMPFTLPSSRFTIDKTDDGFIVRGRGYGHGVGMSQWGAKGRADDGDTYGEILGAYYLGLRPQPWEGEKMIRVAVVRDVGSARVTGNGPFAVSSNGQSLASAAVGGWSVTSTGVRSLEVAPPAGHELPLTLTGVRAPDEVVVDPPEQGRTLDVGIVVPKSAQITATVVRGDDEVARKKLVVEAGERKISIPLDAEKLRGRNTYDVRIEAFDGATTVSAKAEVVLVKPGASWFVRIASLIGVAVLAWVLLRSRRRKPLTSDRLVVPVPVHR